LINTVGGTSTELLGLLRLTVTPPAGAALVSVTVHVVVVPDTMLAGLHDTPETDAAGPTVTVVVTEPPPPLAVTVAVCVVVPDPVPVKVVLVLLAGTVTGLGTLSAPLFEDTVTLNPPAGAALVSVTVQVVVAPDTMLAGLHEIVDTAGEEEDPLPALNVAIWAIYRSARLNVNVAATGPAAVCTSSSMAESILFSEARPVKPVPAVIVPKDPESSITAPKISSPAVVVVAVELVIAFAVVVPLAWFVALTSNGDAMAMPLYSAIRMRRYPPEKPKLTVTVFAPAWMFGA